MSLLDRIRDWQERRRVFAVLRSQQRGDAERLKFAVKDDLTYALEALQRNDSKQAERLWTKLMQTHPAVARSSPLALRVLIGLHRLDEAEALMLEKQKAHPGDLQYARGLVEIAATRGNMPLTAERAAFLRKQFPGVIEGYTIGAQALRKLERMDEAGKLINLAMSRFPSDLLGFMEHARMATLNKDWPAAQSRWAVVEERFSHPSGPLGQAEAMIAMGQYDEAVAKIENTRVRHPSDPGPLIMLARCEQERGDRDAAIKCWRRLVEEMPGYVLGYSIAAEALSESGAYDTAESVLRSAIDYYPDEYRPYCELSRLYDRCGRHVEAAETWSVTRRHFPALEEAYQGEIASLEQSGRPDAAASVRQAHKDRFG